MVAGDPIEAPGPGWLAASLEAPGISALAWIPSRPWEAAARDVAPLTTASVGASPPGEESRARAGTEAGAGAADVWTPSGADALDSA